VNCVDSPEQGLYGFNALTGAVVMQYPLNQPTIVSPCVANNAVYTVVTSSDGNTGYILKLNLAGPAGVYPILRSARSSPTVFNSNIYIGSSNYLYSYSDSASNRPARWRFEAATDLFYSTPTADSNRVYIGSNDGTLYAVNDSSGIKEWEFKSNNRGLSSASSPTLANGAVYYCGIDGLYALNAKTGKLIWSNTEGGGIYSSPCVIDKSGKVYHSGISGIKN
jgi:outer membrane protein assembly factor BamB